MFHQLQCATARDQSFKPQAYEGQLRFELEPCRWQRPVLTWAVLQDFLGCSVTEAHHLLEVFQDSPLIRMPFVLSLAHIPYVILGSSGDGMSLTCSFFRQYYLALCYLGIL